MSETARMRAVRRTIAAAVLGALAVAGCSGGGSGGDGGATSTLPAAAEAGRKVAVAKGCAACHSDDGSAGVGPSFRGLWGSTVELEGGGTVTVDRTYLEESVRTPSAKRPTGVVTQMPVFDTSRVSAGDLDRIQAYLEALAEPAS